MFNRAVLAVFVLAVFASSALTGSILQAHQDAEEKVRATAGSNQSEVSQTPPAPPTPPSGSRTLTLTPTPPPPPPSPKPVKGAPCLSNVSACVKLSARQAWLIADGRVILGPVPITSGKAGERTPTGMHRVIWKDADHKSREFDDAPMPWSVFFAAGGIAFHTGSLRAESNGCIHLADATARRFFNTLDVGDAVQVLR